MFYRQKILLALVDTFGGKLKPTDCQKLMFLYCQYNSRDYYDFFPHKYGAFSLVLHYDKQKLAKLGYLENGNDFRLKKHSSLTGIYPSSEIELAHLQSDVGELRGKNLLRKVYLEYPYYAMRSVVVGSVLNKSEAKRIEQAIPLDNTQALFTLGYEGLTIDKYLNVLISQNIAALVDVRKNPVSRKFGFSKNRLQRSVENAGIYYIHVPELGVPSNMRHNLSDQQDYLRLFAIYSSEILPVNQTALETLRGIIESKGRVALTCFEKEHTCCHRSQITEYLAKDPAFNIPIIHL